MPDVILHSGTVLTMDERTPAASAIAIEGSRVLATGGAAAGRAVLVMHFTFHEAVASSEGLQRAGIGRHTRDPVGGRIVRDRRGAPTGLLLETAAGRVESVARNSAAGTGYDDWLAAL